MSAAGVDPPDEAMHLSITSDTANVARVRVAVTDAAHRIGFVDADVSAVALAVDQALCNVIKHGYEGRSGEPIEVTLEPIRRGERAGLQVLIRDAGRQVDPAEIAGRDLADLKPGGLGTHIIRSVMDEVEYAPRVTGGMEIRLLKMVTRDCDDR